MKEVTGKFNTAKIFTDVVDEKSLAQIQLLCNQEFTEGAKIRLMPDVHAGAGCTIGTTMTIKDKIVPNLVGVDIGCGMETLMIHKDSDAARNFNPAELDMIIQKNIPSGFSIRKFPHKFVNEIEWDQVKVRAGTSPLKEMMFSFLCIAGSRLEGDSCRLSFFFFVFLLFSKASGGC